MIANLGKVKLPDGTTKEQILAALHSIVEKKPEKPSYTIEEINELVAAAVAQAVQPPAPIVPDVVVEPNINVAAPTVEVEPKIVVDVPSLDLTPLQAVLSQIPTIPEPIVNVTVEADNRMRSFECEITNRDAGGNIHTFSLTEV